MISLLERVSDGLRDRFRIANELGTGGMATVYQAEDLKRNRQVALKVLHPEVGAALGRERFRREIRLASKLTHPLILPVLDSGEIPVPGGPPLLWYAMPLARGESLRARLDRVGPLPIEEAARLAVEIADGLDFAHRQGVIHRDIKPENVLLIDGRAVIADFGIALATGEDAERLTSTGFALGTPVYMSPEQATAEGPIDARSDIYAWGCVLYEMLVGEPPFSGPTPMAVMARALAEGPRPIATVRPEATQLEPVVRRALARLPADRFPSAKDAAEAVTAAVRG